MKLGLIGVGGMGGWIAEAALASGIEVHGYDVDEARLKDITRLKPEPSIDRLLANVDTLIVAVPPLKAPKVLEEVRSITIETGWRGGVGDITTFKKHVIPVLERFPKDVDVVSLHPLFGPLASRLDAHKVLIVPVPGRGVPQRWVSLVEALGLRWEVVDWATHDRVMGLVIGLPYAIGHALARAAGEDLDPAYKLSGTTFKALYLLLSTLSDSEEMVEYILSDPDARRWVDLFSRELGSMAPRRDMGLYRHLYCLVEECMPRG